MNDIERVKHLAGINESPVDAEDICNSVAQKAHSWVEYDVSPEQMKAAIWGLFMQFEPEELARIHRHFKNTEAQSHRE